MQERDDGGNSHRAYQKQEGADDEHRLPLRKSFQQQFFLLEAEQQDDRDYDGKDQNDGGNKAVGDPVE